MWDVLLDAFLDALKLFPFLLLLYILIEFLEHETAMGHPMRALSGRAAPFLGAAAGVVPMCGFSVMASKLYEKKYLTLGTLIAVFIATSDEALIVLILSGLPILSKVYTVLALVGCKLLIGAGVGYLTDLIARRKIAPVPPPEEPSGHDHDEEEPSVCEHKHGSKWTLYLFSPFLHALEVAAVVFAFNFVFGALFWGLGEDKVIGFLQGAGLAYQPLVTALVGLIPNCASSVVIAEVYAVGGITFGSLLGGLITNAGFGVFVLFRNVKAWKRNLAVLMFTFALGVAFGYLSMLIEISI